MKKDQKVFWAARIGGRYDLTVVIFVKSYLDFDDFIEKLMSSFPGLFRDYEASYGLYHEYYVHKHLTPKCESVISYHTGVPTEQIDELDRKILSIMKSNARMPALAIAQKIGVNYKTVQNRIHSLGQRKILLGYRLFIRSDEYKPYIVLLSFKEYSKQKEKKLVSELRLDKNATQTIRLFGRWHLLMHVRISDIEALQQMIIGLRERHDIIDEYEMIPVFEDITINVFPHF